MQSYWFDLLDHIIATMLESPSILSRALSSTTIDGLLQLLHCPHPLTRFRILRIFNSLVDVDGIFNSIVDGDGIFVEVEEFEEVSSSPYFAEMTKQAFIRRHSSKSAEMTPLKCSIVDILGAIRASALLPDNALENIFVIFDAFLLLLIHEPECFASIVGTCLQLQEVLQLPKNESKTSLKQKLINSIHCHIASLLKHAASFSGNEVFQEYVEEVWNSREIGAPSLIRSVEGGGRGGEGGGRAGVAEGGSREISADLSSIQPRRILKKKFDDIFMFSKSKIEEMLDCSIKVCDVGINWGMTEVYDGNKVEGGGRTERGGRGTGGRGGGEGEGGDEAKTEEEDDDEDDSEFSRNFEDAEINEINGNNRGQFLA